MQKWTEMISKLCSHIRLCIKHAEENYCIFFPGPYGEQLEKDVEMLLQFLHKKQNIALDYQ